MKTFPSASDNRRRTGWRDRSIVAALCAFAFTHLRADERQPERRELWVPTKDLHEVLKEHPNAVMLDRAQYDALIRDAGRVKPDENDKPPGGIAIESIRLSADARTSSDKIMLNMEITFTSFAAEWTATDLGEALFTLSGAKLDADSLVAWTSPDGQPSSGAIKPPGKTPANGRDHLVLMTKRPGRHVAVLNVLGSVHVRDGRADLQLPLIRSYRSQTMDITLPAGAKVFYPQTSREVSPGLYQVFFDKHQPREISWSPGGSVTEAADWNVRTALARSEVGEQGMTTFVELKISAERQYLPRKLTLALPSPAAQVMSVSSPLVGNWRQEGGRLVIELTPSWISLMYLEIKLEQPWSSDADSKSIALPIPWREGDQRRPLSRVLVFHNQGITLERIEGAGQSDVSADDVKLLVTKEMWPPLQSSKGKIYETPAGFDFASGIGFDVTPPDARMIFRRVGDQFSADVDNYVAITAHEMMLRRSVAIHGEEGRVNRVTLALPANEQFLSLVLAGGEAVEWKQTPGDAGATKLEVAWPKTLQKGQTTTLTVNTRQDITATEGAAQKLTVENVSLKESSRVAGYVALDFDESWKVATPGTTGLESRDARVTPVKGRMAWFNLRDYKLDLEIARNEPVLDGGVLAYALPRAKQVEIEGQITLAVSRAPLRKFDVKLPVATAKLLRVESPLIGQQQLDEAAGVWHFTLRKELLGLANIRFHLGLPATVEPGAGTKLSATLPRFELPTARRFTGQWVIEANTDTELSYETKGVQPLDALRPSRVEGYTPRHRVLAAYGYGAADHSVKLTATRHEAGELVSAVVESMELTSVLSRDGASRHTAKLLVRHNGQQFMAVKLPKAAQLLSAKVDTETVKPVQAGADEVRVPLPANALATVTVETIYELKSESWSSSGKHRLEPPSVGENVPVLSSSWRVYVPRGYEIANDIEGLSRLTTRRTPDLVGLLAGRFSKPGYALVGRMVIGTKVNVLPRGQSLESIATPQFYEDLKAFLESGALRDRTLKKMRAAHPELSDEPVEIRASQTRGSGVINVVVVCENKKFGSIYLDTLMQESIPMVGEMKDWFGKEGSEFASRALGIMERSTAAMVGDEVEMVDFTPKYPKPMFVGTPVPITTQAPPPPAPKPTAAAAAPQEDAPFAAAAPPYPVYYNEQKMQRIILPSVKFQGASVEEALEFLRIKSKDLDAMERDPARRGVNIYVGHPDVPSTAQITLDLKDVPMLEALRYVTELAGMKYKISAEGVTVVPITDTTTELYTRTFKVPPDFLSRAPGLGAAPDPFANPGQNGAGLKGKPSAMEVLKSIGISFPEGSSAVYDAATSQVIVKNTQPNLDSAEAYFEGPLYSSADHTASGGMGSPAPSAGAAGLLPADPFGDDDRRLGAKRAVEPDENFALTPSSKAVLDDIAKDTLRYSKSLVVPPGYMETVIQREGQNKSARLAAALQKLQQVKPVRRMSATEALEALRSSAPAFPDEDQVVFLPHNNMIIIKGTRPYLDAMTEYVHALWEQYRNEHPLNSKSGLISLDLAVPSVGRLLSINGHQKPEVLVLHYQSWERQIAWTVLRLVVGVGLFCWLGRRRPCLRTALAILLLTCLPVWLAPSWLAAANALLAGWLLGFVFHLCRRVAGWLENKLPLNLNLDVKGEAV